MANNAKHAATAKKGAVVAMKTPDTVDMTPRELTKQEFGRRLLALILDRGWTQSELSREADVGRDAISTYVRGKSFPDPLNLRKLATALGVTPEQLLPNIVTRSMASDPAPAMEVRAVPNDPTKMWMRVNRMVSFETAVKVLEVLNADNGK